MFGLSYSFSDLNNENNVFIPTNIGYFTHYKCMPTIPLSAYDERLSFGRVIKADFAEITSKINKVCGNFQALLYLWIIEWVLKISLLLIITKIIIDVSMERDLQSYFDIYLILGIITIEIITFFICKNIINNYEHHIENVLNDENQKKYQAKNLYWRILPQCRYIHLILNYENYINPQIKIVTNQFQMRYSLSNLKN